MHLVGHHVQINLRKTYVFSKKFQNDTGELVQRKLYSQVGLLLDYFKHSCSPNVLPVDRDGDTVYIVIRPIEAGQELMLSNYSFHWDPSTEWDRKCNEIVCNCERCEGRLPSKDEIDEISSDPDYNFVNSSEIRSEVDYIDRESYNILMEKCIKLLKKYGHILWCTEFGIILSAFSDLIRAELHGYVQTSQTDESNNNS